VKKAATRIAFSALALLLATGFAPGPDMSEAEVREKASSAPRLQELYSNPTVETSVGYEDATDAWRVILTEGAAEDPIAYLTVADDSGEVEGLTVLSNAGELDYPSLSEAEAVKLALADERVQAELSEHGPYSRDVDYQDGEWTVRFFVEEEGSVGGRPTDEGKEIAAAGVDDETWDVEYAWVGDQVGWAMARGQEGAYGKQANSWYVWGALALAFALAFWRTDRLFSVRNLDVVALLGFLLSHAFFREGVVYEAVVLFYPPLIYLFFRTLLMGFGIGERVERTTNFPTWVLLVLSCVACGLVLGLNLHSRVIDVGYAGVVGADLILEGTVPYGNMPQEVGTGDTYGPLNYLLYVPFVVLFGFSGGWDFLPAAHALTALSYVAGALALFVAGWRLSGPKVGAALAFAWAAFPYTLYAANNNTNDIVVAALSAIGLAAASSPLGRGAGIAAGFCVKLYPIILAPLWMMHDEGVAGRRRPIALFVVGGASVLVLSFWVLVIDGRPLGAARLFYERTIAFQGTRESPWTIFAQVPELGFLQQPLLALVIVVAFVVAVWPRRRTLRRLAAFSAALVIGFELTTNYWFYPYVTWFEPFVFVALLAATNEKTALDGSQEDNAERGQEGTIERTTPEA
jgi:Glycosyltransferase family 87